MPPMKRKSMMSDAERIARLKESRIKYSQIGKAKTSARMTSQAQPARTASRPVEQKKETFKKPVNLHERPKPRPPQARPNDDFEIDPNSLAMIKSGKITMPISRPSITGRSTIGGIGGARASIARASITGRTRPRASIAPCPRESLMPLGINIFEATEVQKHELSDYVNAQKEGNHRILGVPSEDSLSSSFTPGRKNANSIFGASLANCPASATRQRKIRFMENAIPEQRESADSEEIATTSTIRHSPIADVSFVPPSILSSKKKPMRKKINLGSPKLTGITESSTSSSVSPKRKCPPEPVVDTDAQVFVKMERIVDKWFESEERLGEGQKERVKKMVERLNTILDRSEINQALNETVADDKPLPCIQGDSKPIKTPKAFILFREQKLEVPLRPLGDIVKSILETEDTPSPEESENRKPKALLKNKRRSSKLFMRGGSTDPARSLFRRRSSRLHEPVAQKEETLD